MNERLCAEIRAAMTARGCSPDGYAPNRSMWITDDHLQSDEIDELLDMLIRRRERIRGNVGLLPDADVRAALADVELIAEAVKAVIRARMA